MAVRRTHKFEFRDVDTVLARDIADLCLRPDQKRLDEAELRRLDGAPERSFIARMHHDGLGGRHALGRRDQSLVFRDRNLRRGTDTACGR